MEYKKIRENTLEVRTNPKIERYLRMNEREKDIEIQQAIIRLQNRIQEILYLMETEMKTKINPRQGKQKAE